MAISSFQDLLQAARNQPQPQRLLFVFAGVELPEDSTLEQRQRFEAGEGGALAPLMCVDKALHELTDFDTLVQESRALDPNWQMVFVAALAGDFNRLPSSADAEQPLQRMVEAVRGGAHQGFIPFNRQGQPVLFD